MRPVEDSTASVRIELSEDGGTVAPPLPDDEQTAGRGRRGILTAGAALGVVMALVLFTRPNDGETALGTPITAPSTTSEARTDTGDSATDETVGVLPASTPDELLAEGEEAPDFETGVLDFFPFEVIEADRGWIALGFGNDDQVGGLWRSLDGLRWTRLRGVGLPDGDLVGFTRIDGEFLLAVDETFSWSQQDVRRTEFDQFHISIWRSADAVNWSAATDRPMFDGVGFPYPVRLSGSAYTVPSIGPAPDEEYELLVRYLSEVFEPELARQVCRSEHQVVDDDRQIAFFDCIDEELARISLLDDPELFASLGPDFCVDMARNVQNAAPAVTYVDSVLGESQISLGDQFGLFGVLIGDEFLTAISSSGAFLSPECVRDPIEATPGADILIWGPDGQRTAGLPEGVAGGSIGGSFRGVNSGPDGAALIVGESGLWAAQPPYDSWNLVLVTSVESGGPGANRPLALAFDGTLAMGSRGQNLFFAEPGEEWFEVDIGRRLDFPQLLLATDEFAVVVSQGVTSELIKIPLSR